MGVGSRFDGVWRRLAKPFGVVPFGFKCRAKGPWGKEREVWAQAGLLKGVGAPAAPPSNVSLAAGMPSLYTTRCSTESKSQSHSS